MRRDPVVIGQVATRLNLFNLICLQIIVLHLKLELPALITVTTPSGHSEYLSTAFRATYLCRRISVLHRYLQGLHFSRLEGSRKKQVVANSMHRKDYPYSLLFNLPIYSSEVLIYYFVKLTLSHNLVNRAVLWSMGVFVV